MLVCGLIKSGKLDRSLRNEFFVHKFTGICKWDLIYISLWHKKFTFEFKIKILDLFSSHKLGEGWYTLRALKQLIFLRHLSFRLSVHLLVCHFHKIKSKSLFCIIWSKGSQANHIISSSNYVIMQSYSKVYSHPYVYSCLPKRLTMCPDAFYERCIRTTFC